MLRSAALGGLGLGLALGAAAPCIAPLAAEADEVVINGRRMTGVQVVEETYEKVVYTIAGAKQEIPARDVDEVVYEQAPAVYRAGIELMGDGAYADAADRLLDAVTGRAGWVDQYALFHAAECYRFAGSADQAADTYARLLKDHPKTRFYPAAKLGRGLTLAATGDYDGARKALADLEREATEAKLGERWVARARLETARTHEAQGNKGEALSGYQKLTRQSSKYPEIAFAARLGELRAGTGNVQAYERLIDEATLPDGIRAEAYLALGLALEAAGEPKRALIAYLRAALDPPLERFPEPRAEALYRAAEAFAKVKSPGWEERAEELRQRLAATYPSSRWASQR